MQGWKNLISHEIRDKKGGAKIVKLTPLKAIKLHCSQCMDGVAKMVKNCQSKHCALYPFRSGKAPGHKGRGQPLNILQKTP